VKVQASIELSSGIPFMSDADLEAALTNAGVPADLTAQIVQENSDARLVALRASMAVVALFSVIALFLSERIPVKAIGST
jgi:hypothetical protein